MAHKYENKQAALLAKVKGKTGKISDKTHEEHLKLYTGYVNKSNALLEELEKLGTPDPADAKVANQISSTIRNIKVDLTFALGGLKNHELYFNILGGDGQISGKFRRAGRSRLRLVRELQEGPEGDRHRRPRLGLDRLRPRHRQAAQLHRRRAEHLPHLGRHPGARPRRLRARLLRRLLHRPRRVHR